MAAMDLTGDPDMDRQILDARATQDNQRNRLATQERVAAGELPSDFVYGLPGGKPGVLEIGINDEGVKGPNYQQIAYSTPEEYREAYNLKLSTPTPRESWTERKQGPGAALSIAASLALPFAAPAIAGALAASTGIAALGGVAGTALTGAALGAGKAALFDEDIATGALLGGVSGGLAGYMQGAGVAGAGGAGGAGAGGAAGAGAAGAGGATVGGVGAAGAGASQFAGIPEIVVTASRPAFGAANLVAPAVGGLGAIGALGGTAPVPEIIPEISPFETAGGEFVQTSAPQQSPVTTPSVDQTLTGTTTPAGTYDPATGLTGYIDQTGQFVQTASPVATPTGIELATGAAPAATIAQSPVFGVTDPTAPTFGATGGMTAPIVGSVAGTPAIFPPGTYPPGAIQGPPLPPLVEGLPDITAPAGAAGATGVAGTTTGAAASAPIEEIVVTAQRPPSLGAGLVMPVVAGGAIGSGAAMLAGGGGGGGAAGTETAVTETAGTGETAAGAGAGAGAGGAAGAAGAAGGAAAGSGIGEYLGNVGEGLVSGVTEAFSAENIADLILRGAGALAIDALSGGGDGGASALGGLSAEEQALVLEMRDELANLRAQNENLFNQRLQQAYALIGDVDYFDPEYFGLQSARRAQLQAARAKQAGLRGLTGEERAAEERRFDLETGRSAGTAYDVGYGTGLEARTRARQAGIEAMPTFYPSALSELSTIQDIYRGGSARAAQAAEARRQNTAGLFGNIFGTQGS